MGNSEHSMKNDSNRSLVTLLFKKRGTGGINIEKLASGNTEQLDKINLSQYYCPFKAFPVAEFSGVDPILRHIESVVSEKKENKSTGKKADKNPLRLPEQADIMMVTHREPNAENCFFVLLDELGKKRASEIKKALEPVDAYELFTTTVSENFNAIVVRSWKIEDDEQLKLLLDGRK